MAAAKLLLSCTLLTRPIVKLAGEPPAGRAARVAALAWRAESASTRSTASDENGDWNGNEMGERPSSRTAAVACETASVRCVSMSPSASCEGERPPTMKSVLLRRTELMTMKASVLVKDM